MGGFTVLPSYNIHVFLSVHLTCKLFNHVIHSVFPFLFSQFSVLVLSVAWTSVPHGLESGPHGHGENGYPVHRT